MTQNIKDAARFFFKSTPQPWADGANLDFSGFWETRGPRGGRMVIVGIALHAIVQVDVTVGALQGEDIYRIFDAVTVEQKDGVRRLNNMPGDALRIASFAVNGRERTHEHADVAVGNNAVITATAYVPLAKPFAYEPGDFCLATEMLNLISLRCARAAQMSIGGATVAIDSGSYYVVLECIEQMGLVQHAVDEWIVRDFASVSATELELNVGGRIHDALLYIPGGDGGQSLANLDEAMVEHVMPQFLKRDPELKQFYARARGACTNALSATGAALSTDPFVQSTQRAAAIILSTGTKAFEGKALSQATVRLRLSANLPGVPRLLLRVVKPRSEAARQGIVSKYKPTGSYIHTEGRTQREPGRWRPEYRDVLPEKFTK